MTRRTIRRSNVTIIDHDRTPELLAAMPLIRQAAVEAGAQDLKRSVREVFDRQGDPANWPPNSPITQQWKGHNTIMEGRTGTLKEDVEVRLAAEFSVPRAGEATRFIGWFDDPHPDSLTGLTKGEVAMTHEFGLPFGENLPRGGAGSDPAKGMGIQGGGPEMDIPERPWLSTAADTKGDQALALVEAEVLKLIQGVLRRA